MEMEACLWVLGTLATAVGSNAENFLLVVCDNGEYEITGNQPVAASGRLDYAGMAEAAGFRKVCRFDEARAWAAAVPDILSAKGPTLVHVITEPGTQGPIGRSSAEAARYLQYSLSDWSEIVRVALAESS